MSKRTPWYPSSVNPVRDGVYEWHCPFIYGGEPVARPHPASGGIMIDIIERLRRPIVRVNAEVALLCEAAIRAADEIERLRAERDEHARWRQKLADDLHDRDQGARAVIDQIEWIACAVRMPDDARVD